MPVFRLTNHQWLAKLMAALVAGTLLSLGSMAVLGVLCHANGDARNASSQFLMWFAIMAWFALVGSCFLFRSGLRAWAVLGGAAFVVWGLFAILTGVVTV